jgi:anthranilate 3-monooxygenase (FAD)/4-hydroxyphenylacetate 3-monooxygenase
MAVRTGRQYIDGLKARPREVWLRGERIDDVTTHPAFVRPMQNLARLYDMQHDPQYRDVLTYASPSSGQPVGTAFMMSKTLEDLRKRRAAFQLWAEATFGMMGRSPDFLNTTTMAFAEASDVFGRLGKRYADNIVRYYEHARENDLFLTHALITPQNDRSKTSFEQQEDFMHMGVVRETPDGLIVRGARMLATMGPIADEVMVYGLPGLKPGDERHAMVFALPLDTKGVKLICREPFDEGGRSSYDHPLAVNFEEPDALLVFDDVLVPWDRVFMHNDVAQANALYADTNLRNHTGHQTGVRGTVKLQMALGIAMAIAESVKIDGFLHVQEMLGEAVGAVEIAKSCIVRSEVEYETSRMGTIRTRFTPLQTLRGFLPRAYPKIIETLQTLGAGGLLMMPSAADFASPIGKDVARYYQGGGGMSAEDRVRLFKLAWDLCGDAFGSRQLQYERYYAGDPVRLVASNYQFYENKGECRALVERALALSGDPKATRAGK